MNTAFPLCTAFVGQTRLAAGPLDQVALAAKRAGTTATALVQIYDDSSGRVIDIDPRGNDADMIARLPRVPIDSAPAASDAPRGRGRPKLGVVAREVTLLPRHWDWLSAQSGGASVALRRLVEDARRGGASKDSARRTRDAAYTFMSAMAGNLPEFEEASRALFSGAHDKLAAILARWPADVRDYTLKLADIGTN